MLYPFLSSTKFASFERIKPEEFAQAVFYIGKNPHRVAVVRDNRPFALIDTLVDGLRSRFDVVVLDRVRPDPLAADITAMAETPGLDTVDVVVGAGGGSVMGSAKAPAMLAGNGGTLEEYLGADPKRTIAKKGSTLLLLPTTAGTGAEATKVGVYTSDSGRKYTLGSPLLQADAAILSGSLAAGMPPELTASTGFDALSHALESLWNRNATPLTIEAAVQAARMILETLPPAYEAAVAAAAGESVPGHDRIALRMLESASAAGVAFSMTGTALVHALSFVLSEDWHIPHGTACAFTLEEAYRMQSRDPEIASRLAAIVTAAGMDTKGVDPARYLLDRVVGMKAAMRLPSTFHELGIEMAAGGMKTAEIRRRFGRAFDDPKMGNSYPAANKDEIFAMLEAKA